MNVTVQGMACFGSFGNGSAALRTALASPLQAAHPDGRAATADVSLLKDFLPARSLRQMDHFTRMALLGALLALDDAGLSPGEAVADGQFGIVLATGYGPATPTFSFLDSMLEHGELLASPLAFSHSVHNIPAASVAMKLGLAGPCATVCQFESSVAAGLATARSWLAEGRVSRILFGAVDECPPFLALARQRLLERAKDRGRTGTGAGSLSQPPLAEGAVFLLLGRQDTPGRRGALEHIALTRERETTLRPAALFRSGSERDDQPVFVSGRIPRDCLSLPGVVAATAAYGNLPIAQAFDIVLALDGCAQPAGGAADVSNTAHCLCFCPGGVLGVVSVASSTA